MSDFSETKDAGPATQEWWLAVRSIADLVNREGIAPDEDHLIRQELRDQGFSTDGIGKAMDWMDRAALSGALLDSLGMLQHVTDLPRIDHALERASLHPRILRAIENCRRSGWITQELAERIVEGLRTLDTRDWEDAEIESFFAEMLASTSPDLAGQVATGLLGRRSPLRYH